MPYLSRYHFLLTPSDVVVLFLDIYGGAFIPANIVLVSDLLMLLTGLKQLFLLAASPLPMPKCKMKLFSGF